MKNPKLKILFDCALKQNFSKNVTYNVLYINRYFQNGNFEIYKFTIFLRSTLHSHPPALRNFLYMVWTITDGGGGPENVPWHEKKITVQVPVKEIHTVKHTPKVTISFKKILSHIPEKKRNSRSSTRILAITVTTKKTNYTKKVVTVSTAQRQSQFPS
jgi:hypothetical protein